MNGISDLDVTTDKKQPRGAKRRARTRAELLAAARQVFANHGYHDASIQDITAIADVGVGTFYLHFRDKEEAFTILIDEALLIIENQVVSEVAEHQKFSLAVIIRSILTHAYEQRDLFRIALTGKEVPSRALRIEDQIAKGLTRALDRVTSTDLQGYNIPLLARLITGIIAQGISWWFDMSAPDVTPEQMSEQILQLLQHGLPASLFADEHAEQESGT
ncbi:MAG TPA: TetR/AcrR family transcriptional regulator [Dictyobacter sp.]|jgi:AcrR family transcriptional regulator|nr:TetR/AcrR family transcriptional regulator [Dictyobacter sp.]